MNSSEQAIEGLAELLERFIRQRPRLILPEQAADFQQHMDRLRGSSPGGPEGYGFLIRIFIALVHSEAPPTMGELSAYLDMSLSSATRIVDWLVQADCVERIGDPQDRRVVRVRIADKGQQLYQVMIARTRLRIARLLSTFTIEEQQELLRLLNKLFEALLDERQGAALLSPSLGQPAQSTDPEDFNA